MNNAFEPVMEALFASLQAAAVLPFTASAAVGSTTLTSVSTFTGLFAGLPVFGPGVSSGTVISALNPDAGTITLSNPVTSAVTAGAFTTGFATSSRNASHWTQVSSQPALFLRRIGVIDEEQETFTITTLECEAWIYSNAGANPDVVPDMVLACLEQLIRQSFVPDGDYGDNRFTLGGMVYWCRVSGKTRVATGDPSGQAVAKIPILITLP